MDIMRVKEYPLPLEWRRVSRWLMTLIMKSGTRKHTGAGVRRRLKEISDNGGRRRNCKRKEGRSAVNCFNSLGAITSQTGS